MDEFRGLQFRNFVHKLKIKFLNRSFEVRNLNGFNDRLFGTEIQRRGVFTILILMIPGIRGFREVLFRLSGGSRQRIPKDLPPMKVKKRNSKEI